MSDTTRSGRRIIRLGEDSNSESSIDDQFDDILDGLNTAQTKKRQTEEQEIRAELQQNYRDWAHHIKLLKEHFGEVWDLFAQIQDRVSGWVRRDGDNYGQWGFMGASGYGYNFGVGIHYFKGQLARMEARSKYLVVSFGCVFEEGGNGVGDERAIGRKSSELDDKLVGIENCTGKLLRAQLFGSKNMLEKLDNHQIQFKLYNRNIRSQEISVGIGFLYDNSLKEVCQRLFVALNRDEVIDLPQYLPAPEDNQPSEEC